MWGGNEKWTLRAAEALAQRNHHVLLAVRDYDLWQPHERKWVEFVTLPFANDGDVGTIWKLRKLLQTQQAEIILPTRSRDYWLSGFARIGTGAKYVMRMGITRELRNTVKERLRYGSFPHAIVVNAQAVKDSIARYPWVKAERIHVIYNGVDSDESSEAVPSLKKDGEFLIVAAGRIEADKGFDVLVEAMALALREAPALRCAIFGRGDMVQVVERRIRERMIEDKVRYRGFTSNLPAVLKQANLAVSASYREGVSNFILEAWACGCPIIATKIPGSLEIIGDELRGGLVEAGDAQALAQALLRAYRDGALCRRWAQAGTDAIRATFNWATMADHLEHVLLSVTGQRATNAVLS